MKLELSRPKHYLLHKLLRRFEEQYCVILRKHHEYSFGDPSGKFKEAI
jgi:hypothetical protein